MSYLGGGISFTIFLPLVYYGVRQMRRAKKNYPESAKKIGKELSIGIIGGAIVALAVLAGEFPLISFPFFKV